MGFALEDASLVVASIQLVNAFFVIADILIPYYEGLFQKS
jgi:hypothetical protein